MTDEIGCKVVDVAIVSDYYWSLDAKCPHCNSYAAPETIEAIDFPGYDVLADMMMCTDCNGLYFVVELPFLLTPTPIMTRWKIPDKIR